MNMLFKLNLRNISVACLIVLLVSACGEPTGQEVVGDHTTDLTAAALIPKPNQMSASNGVFPLDKFTRIETRGFDEASKFLSEKIQSKTGLTLPANADRTTDFVISLNQAKLSDSSPEAYQLEIFADSIALNANTAVGAFRGVQTLRQLIPETSIMGSLDQMWLIPTGTVTDAPQYEYRGTMLDVSRHFFTVDDVKSHIDLLSYYKINYLHLHLSDDQGWRIEIKSWPKLAEVGGLSEVGGGEGGFFTQDDYSEIVRYAAAHHITIVPEIDMPGHTNAASVAYPLLNGNGKTPEPYTGMRVGFSTLDTRKDTVYTFIDDVVREIAALTPGPYFHIGGDESHVTKEEDYVYFVNRVEKIVQKYGKRMIGWDEVANTNVDNTSIAQVWYSQKNAQTAANKGMKVILSPGTKAYLDMKYDSLSEFGLTWAGYIPVDTAYSWSPESYLTKENVLGVEAPLWSETISNRAEMQYLAYPRVIGYAELGWTTEQNRDWDDYKVRLAHQAPFLERMNVNFYRSPRVNWK